MIIWAMGASERELPYHSRLVEHHVNTKPQEVNDIESNSTPSAIPASTTKPQADSANTPGYKPKPQGKLLMEITAMSGEYPASFLPRLIPAASYAKKIVSALIGDKLIKPVSEGGLKGYRLTPKGKKQLVLDNPARFAGLLDGTVETNKVRSGHERRLRLHTIAETSTVMHNAGVEIFKDVKPKVYLPDLPPLPSQPSVTIEGRNPGQHRPHIITVPCFYTSREQKGQDDNAIRGSRAAGTLLTPTCAYAIYNTGSKESRWSKNVEQRFKAEVEANICRKLPGGQYEGMALDGVMIGKGMETLEKYLAADEKGLNAYHFLTRVYSSFYYITNDIYGEAQLRLLCDSEKMTVLRNAMLQRNLPPDKSHPVENDAMTEDGSPVLFCCLLDIPRLIRFKTSVFLHKKLGRVAAFDFQADMLEHYLGDAATVVSLNFNEIMARLFHENN